MAEPVAEGALFIADLGYWKLERMQAWSASGRYWLSYLRFNTVILDENQQRQDLLKLLQAQQNLRIELKVFLGEKRRVPARLIAVRVRQETADRRRQRIYDVARRMQRPANQEALALADWSILVTNVPATMLTLREATNLIRVRWQVELLFKLWKSHGQIDEWRSHKPWRILCEIYAKLLTLLIQHWLFLVGFWEFPDRSLFKGAQTIQRFALALAISFADFAQLVGIIEIIQGCLSAGCRINRSSKQPRSFQLLKATLSVPLA
jgi:IS4 transposase